MGGSDAASGSLFSYVDMEERVPATHPLRTIRMIVNEVLAALDIEFEALYRSTGRQSIAPERLLRASLLQAFYTVRSERQLMEQSTIIRCFAGSSASASTTPCGITRPPRRTVTGCSVPMSLPSSRRGFASPQGHAPSVGGTLLGRRHAGGRLGFDSAPRTAPTSHRGQGATANGTSTTRSWAYLFRQWPRVRRHGRPRVVVSLDMAYRSFREVLAGSTPASIRRLQSNVVTQIPA
jgi:Transposase domain (DUF772)